MRAIPLRKRKFPGYFYVIGQVFGFVVILWIRHSLHSMATIHQHGEKETIVKPPATSVLGIIALFKGDSNQSRITGPFSVVFD